MLGIASRYFAGRIALATAAAVVLGLVTGMDNDGHIVMFGTIVLGTAAAAFALLAGSPYLWAMAIRSIATEPTTILPPQHGGPSWAHWV